jgi:hypothetical protein
MDMPLLLEAGRTYIAIIYSSRFPVKHVASIRGKPQKQERQIKERWMIWVNQAVRSQN